MDRKLKQALAETYRAPAPARKAAFLKQHRRRELGRWELAAVQAGYIRWWTWALSLGLFGAILWAAALSAQAHGAERHLGNHSEPGGRQPAGREVYLGVRR